MVRARDHRRRTRLLAELLGLPTASACASWAVAASASPPGYGRAYVRPCRDITVLMWVARERCLSRETTYRDLFVVKMLFGISSSCAWVLVHWLGLGPMVGSGLGVACPKSWRSGCEPATLETEPFPLCPPGPALGGFGFALGVSD